MKSPAVILSLLILFAFPIAASAQWHWAHPQPQGHTLRDVVFLDDNTAIAVGDVGTIMVTHDQGNTWSVAWKVQGVTSTFNSIDRLDANTAVIVGNSGVILRTGNQGASWTVMPSPTTYNLVDVSFGDALHGVAVGNFDTYDGIAVWTADGGATWLSASISPPLRSVDMISATEAFGVGNVTNYTLLHTTNGGASWSPANAPTGGNGLFYAVDFADALHGAIATGLPFSPPVIPVCYVTSDGGATWTSTQLHGGNPSDEFFPGELLYTQSGIVLIASKAACCVTSAFDPPPTGELAISTNNGSTFTNTADSRPLYGLARNDDGVVLAVGDEGKIIRRSTGGSITTVGGPVGQPKLLFSTGSTSFWNSQVGVVLTSDAPNYMFGDIGSYFAFTNDGGNTWSHSFFAGVMAQDVVCMSATEVIAVGNGGVLRSTNGGASWSSISSQPLSTAVRAVAAGTSTHAVAVGSGSNAFLIDNGVVTTAPMGSAGYNDVAFASPTVVLAVGTTDKRSTDGGLTWTSTAGPASGVTALDFVNPFVAYGVSPAGIMLTFSVGDSWFPVVTGAVSGLTDIAFSDSDHGMAVGAHIMTTFNGGATWGEIERPTTYTLSHISMISQDLAFVSGAQQLLFRYGESPVPTLIRGINAAAVPFGADLRWDVVPDNSLAGFSIVRSSGGDHVTIAENLVVTTRSFHDEHLRPGTTYEYQLIAVDRDGSYTQSMPVTVRIPDASVELLPNQPNPFNPVTTIRFVVPEKVRVTISVHDVAGRVVATLLDDVREPGSHEITWNANGMASGVYFARLRAGKTEVSRKMVLLK
ncbi:MAG TPA: YCF48-related protein [Candidatus Krumholzibacteria bacterium]|nr:YCF48-related protein [Candidatus Krumholzibacteria bacterium]